MLTAVGSSEAVKILGENSGAKFRVSLRNRADPAKEKSIFLIIISIDAGVADLIVLLAKKGTNV